MMDMVTLESFFFSGAGMLSPARKEDGWSCQKKE